jgi:hypothetical protein
MERILSQSYSWSPSPQIKIRILIMTDEPKENPRRYKWPWFVLAMVLLGVVLAIVWMSYAVHREKQERNFNAPISAGAK